MPVPALSEIASNIELRPDGVWAATTISGAPSYPEEGNDACFAVEDVSFWFRHRNNCIGEIVRSFPPAGPIFDIGGGNGYVAKGLQDAGLDVVLVEPGAAGARNALRRGILHVVQATAQDAGFARGSLPAAGLFDVVEHIQDDHGFLANLRQLLVPGGRVYLTVPAFQWLWSHEDVAAGHWRRYTLKRLAAVLRGAGYDIEFATCFFAFLPLPVLLSRALPYRLGLARGGLNPDEMRADHELTNPAARRLLAWLTGRELARIAARRPCRFGGSCLVVARKPF
jgi:SAM-dependent methyltransferase